MSDSPAPAGARHAPHTLRNRGPILDVLRRALADRHAVLEIGCGTGEQAPWFARALPHLAWLATDADADSVASAAAWRAQARPPNQLSPLRLDAAEWPWPLPDGFAPDAMVAINVIHIAPVAVLNGLLRGAGALLPEGGVLYLYGPYRAGGRTAPSNEAFDAALRARNPAWGLRDLEGVAESAARHGLRHAETLEMPANNLSLLFRRT